MVEIDKNILFNLLIDFRKKNISGIEKARLIQSYLDETKLSQRQLAKEMDISHSTIQDWLLFNKISKDEYETMKNNGLNQSDIYRLLRNNKKVNKEYFIENNKLQYILKQVIIMLKPYQRKIDTSLQTKELIQELHEISNVMLMKYELELKNKR